MAISDVLAHIDSEIARLQQARELLSGVTEAVPQTKGKRGRPKGTKNAAADQPEAAAPAAKKKAKRKLSPEGRAAIAEAMKRRWEERRKQDPK